jgi:hypothetical protein
MRPEVLSIATLCVLAAPASAQDVAAAVSRNWDVFSENCASAISDPQAYLDTHPKVGEFGNSLIDASPDGQVVVARKNEKGLYFRVEYLGMPGRLAVLCELYGLAGLSTEIGLDTNAIGEMLSGNFDMEEGPVIPSNVVADATRAFFANLPETTIAGGLVPDGLPASMMSDGDLTYSNYIFSVQTQLAGRQMFVYANAHTTALDLTSLNYFVAGE